MLGGDELEVDRMDDRPDLPRALAGGKQVVLDLVTNRSKGISIHQTKVGEKDSHKDGAPDHLIKGHLLGHRKTIIAWNELVQPIVKVVARGSVVQETKGRESDESLHIKGSSGDENLPKQH